MIKYLEISVMGSVTVLLVMLIRLVLQNRVRRSTILLFWMIALARFLIPVSVSSPVSVYNLPVFQGQKITLPPPMVQITGSPQETAHNLPYIEIETVLTSQRTEAATSSQEAGTMLPYLDTETASPLRGSEAVPRPPFPPRDSTVVVSSTSSIPVTYSRITITGLLPYLWLGSSALVLLFFALCHVRSLWRYQFSLPAKALPTAIPKGVRVRILDDLPTPLTYGIFRPVILLPPALLQDDPKDLEHILRHELSHIRHCDVAVKGLMLLAVALHWFNPFVWLLFFAASRDMEMRCDEDVVAQLGQGGKLAYARTLVSIEQKKLVGYLKTGFSFGSTAGRLKAMAGAKPNTAISALAAVCLSLCLIFGFCTTRAAEAEQPEIPEAQDFAMESTEPVQETTPQGATIFAEDHSLPVGKLTTQLQHSKESKAEGTGNFTWLSDRTTDMRVYTTQCFDEPNGIFSSTYIGIYKTYIKHSDGTIAPLEETVPKLYPGDSFTFCVYTIGLPEYQVYSTVPDALEVTYEVIDGTLYGTATAIAPGPATVWIGTSRFNKIMNVADVVVLPPKKTETQSEASNGHPIITWETMSEEERRIILEQTEQFREQFAGCYEDYSLLDTLCPPSLDPGVPAYPGMPGYTYP